MSAEKYFVSDNNFTQRLDQELATMSPSQDVVPLLVDAEVLPEQFLGTTLVPAIYFGRDPSRTREGHVDLLPGSAEEFRKQQSEAYFNPHGLLKKQADKAMKKQRDSGHFFSMSSYILARPGERHLFTDAPSEPGREARHSEHLLQDLATGYNLGTIAIGSEVMLGQPIELPSPGIPAIIREAANTILKLDYNDRTRKEILKAVVDELEHNRSPDYRGWLKRKK